MTGITLGDREIVPGTTPTYVIAEMSANHNGDLQRAHQTLRAAKAAGADAVKLQTYTPDTMTLDCDTDHFRISGGTLWDGRKLYDLYREARTPWEWHPALIKDAARLEIQLFSTPFDATAVDFLEDLDVPAYKVASFELVDIPLLRRIGQTGKPVIASTGMASLAEIDEAVQTLRDSGCEQLALLKCVSAYPADPAEMNLRSIPHLSAAFACPAGLSDHSGHLAVPVAAVTLGACIIEKHLTLSRRDPGPDSDFSLEPEEFSAMVKAVRVAEKALGRVAYAPTASEEKCRIYRRSLFVTQNVVAGQVFTAQNVRSIRPGHGLHPRHLPQIMGRKATRDIARGAPLDWDLVG